MEYDDTIVHQMIECVKVYPDGRLDIIFGGGYLIEERLEKDPDNLFSHAHEQQTEIPDP